MEKSPDAFRTISEVADHLETPAHVLRFWESRFPQIKPVKRAGGRRYYRPTDVALLSGIKRLLHDDGITIRGVQKILREQGVRHVAGLNDAGNEVLEAQAVPPAEVVEETPRVVSISDWVSEPKPEDAVVEAPEVAEAEADDASGVETAETIENAGDVPSAEGTGRVEAPELSENFWAEESGTAAADAAAEESVVPAAAPVAQPPQPVQGDLLSILAIPPTPTVPTPAESPPPAEVPIVDPEDAGPRLSSMLRGLPRGALYDRRDALQPLQARLSALRGQMTAAARETRN